jgi:hypothetical protein
LNHTITATRGWVVVDLDQLAIDALQASQLILGARFRFIIDLTILVRLRDLVPAVADDFLAVPRTIIRGVAVAIVADLNILDHAVAAFCRSAREVFILAHATTMICITRASIAHIQTRRGITGVVLFGWVRAPEREDAQERDNKDAW